MMALYVASHYKNTPNDILLMSDAPAHHLFVLLGPVDETQNSLPDILCVIQVCLEGQISKESALRSLSDGNAPSGDQIPWKVSEQFQDSEFPSLSGVRIVRIAVHPSLIRAGYGSVAVDLLVRYYEGQLTDLTEADPEPVKVVERKKIIEEAAKVSLLEEQIKPRADLPPLLVGTHERRPEKLHYVGVSFGLTQPLYNFWRKHKFVPLYIAQVPSAITGEYSCIVLRTLENDDIEVKSAASDGWLVPFNQDFRRRFISLLGSCFRSMAPGLALSILDPKVNFSEQEAQLGASVEGIFDGKSPLLTPYDMKRLESYANNLADYHLILDLVPAVSRLYFMERLSSSLSYAQAAILLSLGIQQQSIEHVEMQLKLPRNQILALFNKSIRRLHSVLHRAAAKQIETALPRVKDVTMNPHIISVEEDLDEAAREVKAAMKQKLEDMLKPEDLQQFAITGRDVEFDEALSKGGKIPKSGIISIKSMGNGKIDHKDKRLQVEKKRGAKNGVLKSKKKRKE